jgi:transporter family-2 protein
VNTLLVLFVVATGAGLSLQPLLNAKVGSALGHPVYGTLFSVCVSAITMLTMALALRLPGPDLRSAFTLPTFTLTGGVLGAFVVLSALMAAPRLGAATTVALFIAGQLTASLALDHFGLLGVPEHPLDLQRLAGVVCLAAGVALIRWI